MKKLEEDFDEFIAYRLEGTNTDYREICELFHSLPADVEETVSEITSHLENRAYKLGFHDAMRLMIGL